MRAKPAQKAQRSAAAVPACPSWCDGTCKADDADAWRRFHTQPDVAVPATLAGYESTEPTKVLLSLVRRDTDNEAGRPQLSMAFSRGYEDVRLDPAAARDLAQHLLRLADMAVAS